MTAGEIAESIKSKWGDVPPQAVNKAIVGLVQKERLMTYKGMKDQEEKPDLMTGGKASLYTVQAQDVIVTPKKAAEKGWITAKRTGFELSGKKGAEILINMLRKIGSFYERGASTTIDSLDLAEMELPKGGTLRITLMQAPPESMKALGEFFETVAELVKIGEDTEAYLTVKDRGKDCPFVAALETDQNKKEQDRP